MFKKLLVIIPVAILVGAVQAEAMTTVLQKPTIVNEASIHSELLGREEMDMNYRYGNQWVSEVFKDNILLNLAYMSGKINNRGEVDWDAVRAPSKYEFVLEPGQVFAYHDDVLPEYQGKVVKTTDSYFNAADGYRSSGALYGDGVCHFASLINWAAQDAGLEVNAPTNHNFAQIPGIDPMYGTAIYYSPGESSVSQMQNLYVTNNLDKPVRMVFENTGSTLVVSVYK